MMNKKGTIILRDVMFMLIIFGGIMALMSIFVLNLASEYNDTNLTAEYNKLGVSSLGNSVTENVSTIVDSQVNATRGENEGDEGAIHSIGIVREAIGGASKILVGVVTAPKVASNSLEILMNSVGVPESLSKLITNMIVALLWIIIIFGIVTALLKGGKM